MARILLERARSGLRACQRLAGDDAIEDDVVGFHAQQAVEKSVKAVLVAAEIDFPRTHDLEYLRSLVAEADTAIPEIVASGAWLTSWAVQLHYDESPVGLDRSAALDTANAAVAWATDLIEKAAGS